MSDFIPNIDIAEEDDETTSKFSLVIRKPQEGKTFICINIIANDKTKNIHIVLTMNTLSSGEQFLTRIEEKIGSPHIIVFNSNKGTAGNCHHAKTVDEVFSLIRKYNNIKVIICCAHEKRIRDNIPQMLQHAEDSIRVREDNVKFVIHIDEAHKYVPENRDFIREFIRSRIVSSITGYSGSPKKTWVRNDDPLFYKIRIIDTVAELDIIRSPEYFGVNKCEEHAYDHIIVEDLVSTLNIGQVIPGVVFNRAGMTETSHRTWYASKFPFDIGNEIVYLSYIKHIIPTIGISNNQFSYNFVPAYTRKATHYQTVEILLQLFPNANVIVSNGNGHELYRIKPETTSSYIVKTGVQLTLSASSGAEKQLLMEPAYVFQKLIEPFPNCPTFVTGLTCIGMSVTLINEAIGNFDNVVMAHPHLADDKLYQLCRFLFNYMNWSPEAKSRIKKTKFHSLTSAVYDVCLKYEEFIEQCNNDFAGRICTLSELDGFAPPPPTARELRKQELMSIKPTNSNLLKKFKVYDGNDIEMWDKVTDFYKSIRGKDLCGRSKPAMKDGFYQCSTTGHVAKQRNDGFRNMASHSWWSTFQLLPNRTDYARVFVGYDNLEDPTEYTIYIKYAVLPSTPDTIRILNEYGKKNKKDDEDSSVGTESDEDENVVLGNC